MELSDAEIVSRLRAGDERVFEHVYAAYCPLLLRIARSVLQRNDLAEEVLQDAWVTFMRALDDFEQRSTLRTWMARIVVNHATSVARREGRVLSFDADVSESARLQPTLDPTLFRWGFWRNRPDQWQETPETLMTRKQTREAITTALEQLPETQRVVVCMRDVEGFSSEEVCNVLGISESNQRVLLHRGRSQVRASLESAIRGTST